MAFRNRHIIAAAIAVGLGMAASAQAPGTAIHDVKAGADAWMQGDFAGAVAKWRPWADKGDADAQYNLGQAYLMGRGVATDIGIARSWYEKAAQQGHLQAAAHLGLILFQNGQQKQAMPWLRKAADADDPRAEYVVGTAMFNADLLPKDWVRAYAYMSRAANQGLAAAQQNLQSMNDYLPADQRERGLALAREIESANAGSRPIPTRLAEAGPRTVLPPNTALQSTLPAEAPNPVVTRLAPTSRAQAAPTPRVAPVRVATSTPPPAAEAPAARPARAPAHAVPTAVSAATGGAWRVQLGAFSSNANAHRAWETLRGKVGGLAGLQPVFGAAGAVTRLQAAGLANRAAAERVCASAKAAGSACFPVAP